MAFRWNWRRGLRFAEIIVALSTLIGFLTLAFSSARDSAKWLSALSVAQLHWLVGGLSTIVIALGGFAFVSLRRAEEDRLAQAESCSDLRRQLAESEQRFEASANKNSHEFKALELAVAGAEKELDRFRTVGGHMQKLARIHAYYDHDIFNALHRLVLGQSTPTDVCERAAEYVFDDIQDTLDEVCGILTEITGHTTASCLKIIRDFDPSADLSKSKVQTLFRDSESDRELARGTGDHKLYTVDANTITEKIIKDGERLWGDDDLKTLKERNLYRNSRENWWDYYNATLGVGVPVFERETNGLRHWGVLCVDNRHGGLDNDACKDVLLKVSWRFAAMLHRLRFLEPVINSVGHGGTATR